MAPTQIFVLKHWPTFFYATELKKRGEGAGREQATYKVC